MTTHFKKSYKSLEVYFHLFVTLLSAGGCECLTLRPSHFTLGKEPRYPLYRGLGGPQGRSGPFREEKNLLLLPRFGPRTVQPASYSIPALMLCSMSTYCVATFTAERTLRVFENRVLRRKFRPERDGVASLQRKLHNGGGGGASVLTKYY